MKAIFIGGPLHGETKQVEGQHSRVCYHKPRFEEESTIVVTYSRWASFGDTAIFTTGPSEETDNLLIESIERGLLGTGDPPMDFVVENMAKYYGLGEKQAWIERLTWLWKMKQEHANRQR